MDFKKEIISNLETLRARDYANNDKWKVKAYDTVLKQLRLRNEPIYSLDDLKDVKGIGEKIRKKIAEIIETGKLQQVEAIREDTAEMMTATEQLTKVFGIGPIKAKELFEKHHIKSIDDLEAHPELLNEKQKIGVKYWKEMEERIPRKEMIKHEAYIEAVVKAVEPELVFKIMGSFRRGLANSGDIDVLITHPDENDATTKNYLDQLINRLTKDKYMVETLGQGNKKFAGICRLKRHRTHRRIDIMFSKPNEFPFALMYFTGSATFNVRMRNIALAKGYSLSEYGLKYISGDKQGKFVEGNFKTEEDIFEFLGMEYVAPEKRLS